MPIAYKRKREFSPEEIALTEAIDKVLRWYRWIPLVPGRRRKAAATVSAIAAWDALGRPPFKRPLIDNEDSDDERGDEDGGAGVREPRRPSPRAPDDELGLDAPDQR
jgi:hypothetical protein